MSLAAWWMEVSIKSKSPLLLAFSVVKCVSMSNLADNCCLSWWHQLTTQACDEYLRLEQSWWSSHGSIPWRGHAHVWSSEPLFLIHDFFFWVRLAQWERHGNGARRGLTLVRSASVYLPLRSLPSSQSQTFSLPSRRPLKNASAVAAQTAKKMK